MAGTARSSAEATPKARTLQLRTPVERRPEPERGWDDEYRSEWIAENAYYRAERRGFLPGYEMEDWLAAECELEQLELAKPAAQS
jgi:hypothetical protein